MKSRTLLLWLILFVTPAWSETIEQVLRRSQDQHLATMPQVPPDVPGALALQASFARLATALNLKPGVVLRVVGAGTVAETLHGDVIVLDAALGELPEACRLFLLAHEIGHVVRHHWEQRIALYRGFIPGEVVQADTDAVASRLGRAASKQSQAHEFAADAFAMRALLDLGYDRDDLLQMFMRLGSHPATATHPSTGQRLAQLRAIQAGPFMASMELTDDALNAD